MKMPFGKHKGQKIEDLPSDYLKWVAENIDNETICCEADDEYQWRENTNDHWYED